MTTYMTYMTYMTLGRVASHFLGGGGIKSPLPMVAAARLSLPHKNAIFHHHPSCYLPFAHFAFYTFVCEGTRPGGRRQREGQPHNCLLYHLRPSLFLLSLLFSSLAPVQEVGVGGGQDTTRHRELGQPITLCFVCGWAFASGAGVNRDNDSQPSIPW